MIRQEYVIVGIILVIIGIGLCIVGYNKTQPTGMEKVISFIEKVSGKNVPSELKSSKTEGYLFIIIGVIGFLVGVGIILKSRIPPNTQNKNNKKEGL